MTTIFMESENFITSPQILEGKVSNFPLIKQNKCFEKFRISRFFSNLYFQPVVGEVYVLGEGAFYIGVEACVVAHMYQIGFFRSDTLGG